MKKTEKKFDLGNGNIGTLLAKMAIPASIAMIVNGLFYVVDAIFVGIGVGTYALGGMAVVFPLQMFFIAIGSMIGTGAAAVISRNLGERDHERACRVCGNTFTISLIAGIVLTILMTLLIRPVLISVGATEANYIYAWEYLHYLLMGGVVSIFVSMAGVNLTRSEGNAMVSGSCMILGAVLNVILDPLFIFIFDMGIKGAAIATVIARLATVLIYFYYYSSGKSILALKKRHFRLSMAITKEIFSLGAGAFFSSLSLTILAVVMNISLRSLGGDLYLSLYGIVSRILVFLTMPLLGLGHGFQPIAGYNFGSGRYDRVLSSLKLSLIVSTGMCLFFFFLLQGMTEPILALFSKDPLLVNMGVNPLRIMSIFIPLIGFQIIGFTLFQSVGKAFPALILALSRQFFLLIPFIFLFSHFLGLKGVWIAYPVSDLLSSVISLVMIALESRKIAGRVPATA